MPGDVRHRRARRWRSGRAGDRRPRPSGLRGVHLPEGPGAARRPPRSRPPRRPVVGTDVGRAGLAAGGDHRPPRPRGHRRLPGHALGLRRHGAGRVGPVLPSPAHAAAVLGGDGRRPQQNARLRPDDRRAVHLPPGRLGGGPAAAARRAEPGGVPRPFGGPPQRPGRPAPAAGPGCGVGRGRSPGDGDGPAGRRPPPGAARVGSGAAGGVGAGGLRRRRRRRGVPRPVRRRRFRGCVASPGRAVHARRGGRTLRGRPRPGRNGDHACARRRQTGDPDRDRGFDGSGAQRR